MVGLRSVLDVQKNKHLTGETRNKKKSKITEEKQNYSEHEISANRNWHFEMVCSQIYLKNRQYL